MCMNVNTISGKHNQTVVQHYTAIPLVYREKQFDSKIMSFKRTHPPLPEVSKFLGLISVFNVSG